MHSIKTQKLRKLQFPVIAAKNGTSMNLFEIDHILQWPNIALPDLKSNECETLY